VTDEHDALEPLRELRPDRLQSADPNDPWLLAQARDRLLSEIHQTRAAPTAAWRPPAIYPRLGYQDEIAAIEFLTRVFGFRERREARVEDPEHGVLAWLELGEGLVMVGPAEHEIHKISSPRETGQATCMIHVHVDDVDAHYERAVAQGAVITMALNDAFYGERRYEADDIEGNRWHFGEPLPAVR
jgi:uncharacterized glyoxalase superfamily protein PhnB